MLIARLIFLFFLISTIFSASATVYKWTDAKGKVHYSDQPFDENSKQIKMKNQPSETEILQAKERANVLINKNQIDREQAEEDQQKRQIAKQKALNDSKTLSAECKKAKNAVRALGQGRVSYLEDEKGEKHYLSDKEKEQQISELKKVIEEYCGED